MANSAHKYTKLYYVTQNVQNGRNNEEDSADALCTINEM